MKRLLTTVVLAALLPLAVVVGALAALVVAAPVAPVPHVATVHDPLRAGQLALVADDPLLAIAYLAQVPRSDHGEYSRAQRIIGYRVYVQRLGRPAEGLRYTLRSIAAEPLSGNAWEDAARTVAAVFGRARNGSHR